MLFHVIQTLCDQNLLPLFGGVWFLRYMEEDAHRLNEALAALQPARAVARYRCR